MRRPLLLALATLLLLGGCSAPPPPVLPEPEPEPPPVERPTPPPPVHRPPGDPALIADQGRLLIQGVDPHYLWYLGGSRVAVQNAAGLWSIQPDSGRTELLAPAGPNRLLIGPFADGLLYLDRHPEAVVAYLARPGASSIRIAQFAHPRTTLPGFPTWTAIRGNRLYLALEGQRLHAIDLESGKRQSLGDEPLPVSTGEVSLSPNRPVLAYKLANREDPLRLLNLETGQVSRPTLEAQLGPVAWSPSGERWAIQAAEPGAELPQSVGADMVAGGTHLDLGDWHGGLRHLQPPMPLETLEGPWWSEGSDWLALTARDATELDAAPHLWVVGLATEEWHDLGPVPEDGFLTGFAPSVAYGLATDGGEVEPVESSAPALMLYTRGGLHLWPVTGEEPIPATPAWPPQGPPLHLADGSLLYLGMESTPKLYQLSPGAKGPIALLDGPYPKGGLSQGQRHLGVLLYRGEESTDLLLLLRD